MFLGRSGYIFSHQREVVDSVFWIDIIKAVGIQESHSPVTDIVKAVCVQDSHSPVTDIIKAVCV